MNLKQALERIEELERRVRELEARKPSEIHYHNYPTLPAYYPPAFAPITPGFPSNWPSITCRHDGT